MPEIHLKERVLRPYRAFDDREDAGRALREFLKCEPLANAFVLALPRGGVPVGGPVAAALHAPLDLALVRKLPIPRSPEMGFGAVAIDGSRILNPTIVRTHALGQSEIESITQAVLEEVRRRAREYLGHYRAPSVKGRDVYMVDDGLATGYSMIAAAKMVRNLEPRSLILCVPVTPDDSVAAVQSYFDEIFVLIVQARSPFAVASFYRDFHDMSDDEVREILQKSSKEASNTNFPSP